MTTHLLNPVDTLWWRTDRAENLMVIECLVRLEGRLDRERFARVLQQRLVEEFPVFSRRPRGSRLLGALPRWHEQQSFRVEDHLQEVELPDGSDDAALQAHLARFLGRPLDPARSPWEIQLIEGHPLGTTLYVRLHHALADGIALTRVLFSITDEVPDPDLGPISAPPVLPGGSRAAYPGGGREQERAPARAAARQARALVRSVGTVPGILGKLLLSRMPPNPLCGDVTRSKVVVWSEPISLAQVKAVARDHGATVNDVLVSALAGAVHRYQASRGARPVDLPTMIPVNLRPLDQPLPSRLGNRFALVLLTLPSSAGTAAARLAETQRRMDRIKASPEPLITFLLLHAIGLLGPRVGRILVRFFAAKAIGVTTNVPGPGEHRYLAGQRVEALLGWVPGSGHHALGTCIFTYAGSVHVGFKTDTAVVPDPEVVLDGFQAEIDALLARLAPPPAVGYASPTGVHADVSSVEDVPAPA